MNKWIAEFELEDGDSMPEHMDLNYMGARIDFRCRPLVQEPKTDSDCISRAETMAEIQMNARRYTIAKEFGGFGQVEWSDNLISIKDALDILRKLPSVKQEPKAEWIPVTEKLPEEGEEVLVWYEYDRYGDYNCMWQTCGLGWQRDAHFYVDNGGLKPKVIAWCPLPKEYKESEVEDGTN